MSGHAPDALTCAVVGCGAVAERMHLPALARADGLAASLLVDPADDRARALAERYGVPHVARDYHDVIGRADAAVIGAPSHLHEPIACALLEAGVHVLVEKPMALTPAACDRMLAAAGRGRAVLAVGLLRRAAPSLRWVKRALDGGLLGRIRHFELREGSVYNWPVASAAMFRPGGGGGVLADAGAHVLDLILWWFGDWRACVYRDDARGGVEADCRLDLEMSGGAVGTVELSRTRTMPNTCVITGERGTIEVGTKTDSTVAVRWSDGVSLSGRPTLATTSPPASLVDLCVPQLERFVRAIRLGEPPLVSGADARPSIALLAACYESRRPWVQPWDVNAPEPNEREPMEREASAEPERAVAAGRAQ